MFDSVKRLLNHLKLCESKKKMMQCIIFTDEWNCFVLCFNSLHCLAEGVLSKITLTRAIVLLCFSLHYVQHVAFTSSKRILKCFKLRAIVFDTTSSKDFLSLLEVV